MLCSEVELGISEASDGILILSPDAPAGADLARQIGLLDEVLEVNVTPNRPDALSHVGIAREVAALFGARLQVPAARQGQRDRAADRARRRRPDSRRRGLPALQRPHHHRPAGRPEPARDARAPGRVRDARDLEPGRRHQLRDAGDRASAARVRPRQAEGRHPHPAGGARRAHDHARRCRSPAAGRRRGDRRRRRRDRAGRRDGRRGQRDLGGDDRRCCWRRRRSIRARSGARPSGSACTARRRIASSAASTRRGSRTRAGAPPPCWRAPGAARWRGRGSTAIRSSRSCGACRCRSRGCRAWRGSRSRSRRRRRS